MIARPLIVLIASAIIASPVSATLIDLGNITRDTTMGLDWLDLTESVDFSFAQIQAGAGGFAAAGWQHATTAEVCALFGNHATAPAPCPSDTPMDGSPGANDSLIDLLGVTATFFIASEGGSGDASMGLFDDTGAGIDASLVGRAFLISADTVGVLVDDYSATSPLVSGPPSHPIGGNFLVRPIPEPSTALLLGFGLAALALRRRRAVA